ncbi:hypothetical protein PVAP13_3KG198727 [Panicum virgatum]|uniref:PRA1 family protein n=1 Tax=Panicum virgatum TaxID=38727 RepID=A0A8T0USQ7_PANVG|nr:hypothetical protein PVAP13_3KG198727 [Panicum virgatum]
MVHAYISGPPLQSPATAHQGPGLFASRYPAASQSFPASPSPHPQPGSQPCPSTAPSPPPRRPRRQHREATPPPPPTRSISSPAPRPAARPRSPRAAPGASSRTRARSPSRGASPRPTAARARQPRPLRRQLRAPRPRRRLRLPALAPRLPVVFLACFAAWLFLYFLRDRDVDQSLLICGRPVSDGVVIALLSAVTLVLLLLTGATSNILISLLVGLLVVLFHALLHRPADSIDEEAGRWYTPVLPSNY